MQQKKFLFIGDSLIEFFDWQSRFPAHRITNLGVAGETAQALVDRAHKVVKRFPPPDLVLIMIGTNNVVMEDFGFLPAYEELIDIFSEGFPDAIIVINSLLPMRLPWLADDTTQRINSNLLKLAEAKGVRFLNTYQRFLDKKERPRVEYFLEDGVHLSDEGYEAWAKAIDELQP